MILAVLFLSVALAAPPLRGDQLFRVAPEPSLGSTPSGWKAIDPAPPAHPMRLVFSLRPINRDSLVQQIETCSNPSHPQYGVYWSVDQLRESVAAPPAAIQAVRTWLLDNGVTSIELSGVEDAITVSTTASIASQLLHVPMYKFRSTNGDEIIRAHGQYTLPVGPVANAVEIVSGVSRFPLLKSKKVETGTGPKTTPDLIRSVYNVTWSNPPASGNLQSVVSFLGQFYSPDDLKQFEKLFDVPDQPITNTIGPNNASNPGMEASLDVQYLLGVSRVETWVWSTPGTHETQEPFIVWLTDVISKPDDQLPLVFSISYQDMEDTISPEYMKRVSDDFMKLGARGRTLLTGSGDWGTQCNDKCTRFRPDFPSSSPYIVSTGATQFLTDEHSPESGTFWSSGGFSDVFDRPSYQDAAVEAFLNKTKVPPTYFNAGGRGFPDVSALGVNFQVVLNGKVSAVGGTSAATPTFGAIVSLLNDVRLSHGKSPMGFIVPWLYEAAAKRPDAFRDVTHGNNVWGCCKVGFDAVEGWDPITGLGTPNWAVLAELALG